MTDLSHNSEFNSRFDPGVLVQRGWLSRRARPVQDLMLSIATERCYRPGETLYHQGDPGQGVFGVAEGWVSISIPADDGQEVLIHAAGPGFWIGDLAMLSADRRTVTVTAMTPVRSLFLSASRVEPALTRAPMIVRDFYALSAENTATTLRILGIDRVSLSDRRLALRLAHLAGDLPDPQPWLPLTQDVLAALTSTSLPSVQRALARLSDAGLVQTGYGGLRLLDRDGLCRYGQS